GLQDRAHLAHPDDAPAKQLTDAIGVEHTGDRLQQGRLARAVEADQPHGLAGVDGEVHVLEREEAVGELLALQSGEHQLLERMVVAQGELLGDVLDAHHLAVGGDRGGFGHGLDVRAHRGAPLPVPGRSAAWSARRRRRRARPSARRSAAPPTTGRTVRRGSPATGPRGSPGPRAARTARTRRGTAPPRWSAGSAGTATTRGSRRWRPGPSRSGTAPGRARWRP